MEKYDFDNLCLNCLGRLNDDRVCLSCGKKSDDTPALSHHLPKASVLKKKYLIEKAIGEGGFGITYLAWDLDKKEKVAIKEYFPSGNVTRDEKNYDVNINSKQHASANRGLKRFIDEAQILSKIKTLDGIVEVRDFFSAHNTAYIVMEFLDGISLKRYIARKGKLSFDTALTILHPVIVSLKEVHAANLLHRDISPDNILITKSNEVKLIDFGAAKRNNDDEKNMSVILKQGFAPEEQYRLDGIQGAWTDIYALGVTIYYCITGQLPPESVERLKKDKLIPPSNYGAVISADQEKLLLKAISVKAEDRFQTMAEMESAMYRTFTKSRTISDIESRTHTTGSIASRPSQKQNSNKIYGLPVQEPIEKTNDEKRSTKTINEKNARISVKIEERPLLPVKPKNIFQKLKERIKGE